MIIPIVRIGNRSLLKSAVSQLSFEYVKPHSRSHLRTIPVQGYQRTRRIPAATKATEATKAPSADKSNTEQAVDLAAQLDPNNMGVLVGAFQRAHAAGYSGRAAQSAASQLYWAQREGPIVPALTDYKAFVAATAALELRPELPHLDEDLYRTHLQMLGSDAKLKMLRDAGYTGKYLHPLVLEDALVRIWRKEQMKKSITHVYIPGVGLLKTVKLSLSV